MRAVLIAAALLFAGCGGERVRATFTLDPVPGPRIAGTLVVLCGPDNTKTELYSLANGSLQRLTVSDPSVNTFSVSGDTLAISRDAFWSLNVELTGFAPVPVRGRDLGPGQQVALRDARTVAFSRVEEHSSGLLWDQIYVRRLGSRARRVAEFRNVWHQRYVRGRLWAVVGQRHKLYLARSVGTPQQRLIRLRTPRAVRVAISRTGRAAYTSVTRGARRMRFISAAGTHGRSYTTPWIAVAWSPDERTLLVHDHFRLGLLEPSTGKVDEVEPLACGWVAGAQWRGG